MALTILMVAAVLARRLFNPPFIFTDEVSGYLLASILFLALANALRVGRHVKVELVTSLLSPKVQSILTQVTAVIGIAWVVPLFMGCWHLWSNNFQYQTRATSGIEALLWIPSLVLVIGSALLGLQLIAEIVKHSPLWKLTPEKGQQNEQVSNEESHL